MIAIINYGLGNIKAFANIYKKLEVPFLIASKASDLTKASKFILPGVGSFDHAMELLEKSGMHKALEEFVLVRHVPVLGICVGMQILARSSEEGLLPGLGWIEGEVKKFNVSTLNHRTHLPHMGWNDVQPTIKTNLFQSIEIGARFYFLHSYYFHCSKKMNAIAVSDYGGDFTCAVNSDNIYGVQFHPEKSHHYGIQLLKNFSNL
jgi:imidazole glycerol-phosphate synthase subunit HisH